MTTRYTKIDFVINFIFSNKKDMTFPVQIVSIENNKHEMSKPLSRENISKCYLLKSLPRVLRVNISVVLVTHK